ncbi:MAG TPA: S4 domain-containing protein, partial [Chthoniobacterales bacterium]
MAKAIRLDQALVERGLFPSRQKAQSAIMAGEVTIGGHLAKKASDSVGPEAEISVAVRDRYVGRGGIKLEGAIAHFGIDCAGKIA